MAWIAISVPLVLAMVAIAVLPVLYASLRHQQWHEAAEMATPAVATTGRLAAANPSPIPGAPVTERTPLAYFDEELVAA